MCYTVTDFIHWNYAENSAAYAVVCNVTLKNLQLSKTSHSVADQPPSHCLLLTPSHDMQMFQPTLNSFLDLPYKDNFISRFISDVRTS